ncbi:MAG: hypothetical protein NZT61_07680 [Deltaproteobacteria bacterium]|nr:hypothetical protein [Deltaproteobacteria bacterium]
MRRFSFALSRRLTDLVGKTYARICRLASNVSKYNQSPGTDNEKQIQSIDVITSHDNYNLQLISPRTLNNNNQISNQKETKVLHVNQSSGHATQLSDLEQKLHRLAFDLKLCAGIISERWNKLPFYKRAIQWTQLKESTRWVILGGIIVGACVFGGALSFGGSIIFGPVGLSTMVILSVLLGGALGDRIADFNIGFSDAKFMSKSINNFFESIGLRPHGDEIVMKVFFRFDNGQPVSSDNLFHFLREQIVMTLKDLKREPVADELYRIMSEYS